MVWSAFRLMEAKASSRLYTMPVSYTHLNGLGEALRHAAFQVGSIITTTGFSSLSLIHI